MSNSFDPNAPYRMHDSVLECPEAKRLKHLMRAMNGMPLSEVLEHVRYWIEGIDTDSFEGKVLTHTVEWDLRTHYGVTDEHLRIQE